jgi:hypothetical protein
LHSSRSADGLHEQTLRRLAGNGGRSRVAALQDGCSGNKRQPGFGILLPVALEAFGYEQRTHPLFEPILRLTRRGGRGGEHGLRGCQRRNGQEKRRHQNRSPNGSGGKREPFRKAA